VNKLTKISYWKPFFKSMEIDNDYFEFKNHQINQKHNARKSIAID
jgi:uncharacterized protein (UPF0332 family)